MDRKVVVVATAATVCVVMINKDSLTWWWKKLGRKWFWRKFCVWYRVPRHLRKEVRVSISLAYKCGQAIVDAAQAQKETEFKDTDGTLDPCTATDKSNEKLVIKGLRRAFPRHAIIGEESASELGALPGMIKDQPTWIVDPIDGTQNFVHGVSLCCVSIGLALNGRPQLGVVYDPFLDELFLAVAGSAFLDGRELNLDKDSVATLSDALVLIDPGYERATTSKLIQSYSNLLKAKTRAIRIIGSTVLSLCWLAAGRASAVLIGLSHNDSPKPWDFCAATLIAHCAGATVQMIDDRRHTSTPISSYSGTSNLVTPVDAFATFHSSSSYFDLYSMSVLAVSDPRLLSSIQSTIINNPPSS